jgi:type VI secretion system FHA domain protein
MTLRLSIVNASRPTLDNGGPVEFSLDQRGALIGRSPGCDWSLPDARNHISSRHCEIRFEQGRYVLNDTSTNGTFLNDRADRMIQPHVLQDGDVLSIGHYRLLVSLNQGPASVWARRPHPTTTPHRRPVRGMHGAVRRNRQHPLRLSPRRMMAGVHLRQQRCGMGAGSLRFIGLGRGARPGSFRIGLGHAAPFLGLGCCPRPH